MSKLKPKLTVEIVRRPDDLHTFQVLPRRWVTGDQAAQPAATSVQAGSESHP
jgi:hypothetical protein